MIEIILTGEMNAKKNRYKRGRYGGMYLDKDNQKRIDEFISQIITQKIPKIIGEYKVEAYFLITKNKDIDNMLGSLFDILQEAGVITNDRNIFQVFAEKKKTKKNPMTMVKITTL